MANGGTDRGTEGRMEGWTEEWIEGWTEGQMSGNSPLPMFYTTSALWGRCSKRDQVEWSEFQIPVWGL